MPILVKTGKINGALTKMWDSRKSNMAEIEGTQDHEDIKN